MAITDLDYAILITYRNYAKAKGYSPDIGTVAHKLSRVKSHIHGRLVQLQAAGLMTHVPYTARTWRLTWEGEKMVKEG